MQSFLLLASLSLLVACNSGKKKEKSINRDTTTVPAPPPLDPPPGVVMQPDGKIDIESFGDIKLGQSSADLLKVLGEPEVKSKAEEWGADGLMHQDWVWSKKGLEINMAFEKGKEATTTTVSAIMAKAPSTYKTKAGIGIGSTYEEVQAAYTRDINAEESTRDQVTVGSVYGGIIFTMKNDKVQQVFLGAAAE